VFCPPVLSALSVNKSPVLCSPNLSGARLKESQHWISEDLDAHLLPPLTPFM